MTDKDLKEVRGRLKLTQEQIAEKIGVTRSTYNTMEQGRYPVSETVETKVMKLLALEEKKKEDAKAKFMAYIMANRGKKI